MLYGKYRGKYLQVIQYAVEVDAECSLFPLEWLFHFRWGKKPGKVNGKMVTILVIILTKAIDFTGH